MLKLEEIKKDLRHGDHRVIHDMTQIPLDTITSVLCGRRSSTTERGQSVLSAAQKVIANRKLLLSATPGEAMQARAAASNQPDLFTSNQ